MNNMVNCSLLLDDAEAKEAAVEEVSRLEAALEASESAAKQQATSFKVSWFDVQPFLLCTERNLRVFEMNCQIIFWVPSGRFMFNFW